MAFRLRDGRARPVCSHCGVILAEREGEGGQPPDRALVRTALAVQQRITASVHGEIPEREQLEKALATLWAPLDHPAAARPVLALWFNEVGWRCPYEARHAVGAEAPLGQLPISWRFLTLLALHEVFGSDPRVDGALPAAVLLARRAAPRQIRLSSRRPRVSALMRSSAEYERLAHQVLADPRWRAAQELPFRKRQRVCARLIEAALSKNPVTVSRHRGAPASLKNPGASLTNPGQSCLTNSDSESHKPCAKRAARPLNRINSGRPTRTPDWREFPHSAPTREAILEAAVRGLSAKAVRLMNANFRRFDAKTGLSGGEPPATPGILSIKAKTTDKATLSRVIIHRQVRRFWRFLMP
ncbi:hypothetical protein [Bradyrhizobium sp. CCGUVB23]|uniref:hypothetical protein n=1 Tax=Bradyrhizobium sp. CCGUVB23 TaxID=2949630 RepID=UPI0020B35EA7|nr:hypothetical protein [Bradyrhizobium sp. CCGUVB23]MCP3468491.1 hypothetical protein [Bradyrhizobium sp. CCGUVB23]